MKKRTAKTLSVFVAAMLAMGAAACGDSGGGTNESGSSSQVSASVESSAGDSASGSKETEQAPVEKTWTDDDSAEITILMSGSQMPDDDNIVIKELEKRTGTKINLIYVAAADVDTKLSAMISSDTIPDIFNCTSLSQVADLKNSGLLADMGDVLNAVAPNVINEVGEAMETISVNKDGIYLVPNANRAWGVNVCIRTDWLENLELDMPTDLESFANVMHAFTYDDPDGNGKNDTIGYSFSLSTMVGTGRTGQNIFGAFGIAKGHPMEMEDGTVTSWVKHPKFLDAMRYLKRLVDDGVCEPDYVSVPNQTMFEKIWNGTSGCIEWECVGPTNNWMPSRYVEDPPPEFGFAVLKGPDGDYGTSATYKKLTSGWVFSASCKNLEGAARIANFLMSDEGSELLTFGVEDVMYKWVDKEAGTIEYLDPYTDSATHRAAGGYCYAGLFSPGISAEFRTLNEQTREGVQEAWDLGIDWAYVLEPSQVAIDYGADMDQVINEMFAELLLTDEDKMQEVYDRYIAEWEKVGGSDWEAEMTELWKAQKELSN